MDPEDTKPKTFKGENEVSEVPAKQEIMLRLEQLPGEIKKKEFDILGYSNNADLAEDAMKKVEIAIKGNIAEEKEKIPGNEEKGIPVTYKKKYPNEDARLKEVNHELERNQDYKNHRRTYEHNKKQLKRGEVNLKYLINTFAAAKWMSRLIAMGDE